MGRPIDELTVALGLEPDFKSWQNARQRLLKEGAQIGKKLDSLDDRRRKAQAAADKKAHADKVRLAKSMVSLEKREFDAKMRRIRDEMRALKERNRIEDLQRKIADRKAGKNGKNEKGGGRSGPGLARRGMGKAMGVLGISPGQMIAGAGLVTIAAATQDALAFDDALTDMQINGKMTTEQIDKLRTEILKASAATGVAKEDILAGAASFVTITGDSKTAQESIMAFALAQKATKATASDLAATAGSLSQQLGLNAKDFQLMFSILHKGAKDGSVEFSEMAGLMAEMSAAYQNFAGAKSIRGLSELSAMFQTAKQGFGTSDEARTGIVRMLDSLSQPRTLKALKALGISTMTVDKDGTERMRNALEIIKSMRGTIAGRSMRWQNAIFESSEARKAFQELTKNMDQVDRMVRESANANDIAEDAAKRSASASDKVKVAINGVKIAAAEAFTPERIQAFADGLSAVLGLVSGIGKGISAISYMIGGDPNGTRVQEGKDLLTRLRAAGLTDEEISSQFVGEHVKRQVYSGASTDRGLLDEDLLSQRRYIQRAMTEERVDKARAGLAASVTASDSAMSAAGAASREYHRLTGNRQNPDVLGFRSQAYGQSVMGAPNQTVNVTVPPGTDAEGVGEAVRRAMLGLWESSMRGAMP